MIRVVPLDTYDETQLGKFCQILYTAFGVGTQLVTDRAGSVSQETLDAVHFLEHAPFIPAYADDKINVASKVDLLIGVVPIINLEWIQKLHRDQKMRGYSQEAVVDTMLRRMPDYINHI